MDIARDDLFNCTICFNPFNSAENKARLLNCHHTFCEQCLIQISNKKDVIACPLCQQSTVISFRGVHGLAINYYLDKFSNLLDSISSLDITNNAQDEDMCNKHATKKFFWCRSCSVSVCVHCMGLDHSLAKSHDVVDLSLAMTEMQSFIQAKVQNALSLSSKIKVNRQSLKGNHDLIAKAALALKNTIAAPGNSLAANDLTQLNIIDKDIGEISQFLYKENFAKNVRNLHKAKLKLITILQFLESFSLTMEQKSKEAKSLRTGTLVVSVVRPELKFDYGRLYCIRCGSMCDFPRVLQAGQPGNPYGVNTKQNLCKNCGISILEFKDV